MNKKGKKNKTILYVLISLILASAIFFMGYKTIRKPYKVYRVYLNGETIGFIEDKEEFENLIDTEQTSIKDKYKVDKVYIPNELDISKEMTYSYDVSTAKEMYEYIKDLGLFTVDGYSIFIKGTTKTTNEGEKTTPDRTIYVINKDIFKDAIQSSASMLTGKEKYTAFINETQTPITDVGSIIENIYIDNQIIIRKERISTANKIFTDVVELNQYLIFGTNETQKTYTVKENESIEEISFNNQLSVEEFLIANPEFKTASSLLYAGQVVNLGLISPLIDLVEIDHTVEYQEERFETVIEYDNNLVVGYDYVKQNGVNGLNKVTKKVKKINGEIDSAVITNTETIEKTINKIIVKGKKVVPNIGDPGVWAWPTNKPYVITSPYGWRWGKFHEGLDISGTGYGSPIYAVNNGTVEKAEYNNVNGNYIYINHNNGYYSVYAHMATLEVRQGQTVSRGQRIGTMGMTGLATGTHLHFQITTGNPWFYSHVSHNPLSFY